MKLTVLASVVVAAALVSSANAGFVAQGGTDTATVLTPTPALGNVLVINAGTFSSYTPDTAADPQIGNSGVNDIARYGYTFNTLGTVANLGGSFTYTGTYEIFYNTDNNDTRDAGDRRVSSGTASLNVNLITNAGGSSLQVTAGELMQLLGPQDPQFADLSYGGSNVGVIGFINIPLTPGTTGTANLTFRQNAVAPEPTTLAALAGASVLGLRRRRC